MEKNIQKKYPEKNPEKQDCSRNTQKVQEIQKILDIQEILEIPKIPTIFKNCFDFATFHPFAKLDTFQYSEIPNTRL